MQNYYFSYITIIVLNVKTLTFTFILLFYTGEQTVVLLPRSASPYKRYFPISLDSLEDQFRIRSADDCKLFREEFNVGSFSYNT